MKGRTLVAIIFCLFSCSQEDLGPVDRTVHLAGFLQNSTGGATASYWKDGAYTNLTHDSIYSQVNSLYVDGSSVLIGGWKIQKNSPPPAVIWQDREETVIDGAFGSPVLIASRNNNLFGVWHVPDFSLRWVFYKNGNALSIADTALNIGPTGLALLEDDMYISGSSEYHDWTSPNAPTYQHAQCWKNGQLIFRENELSNAMSIFIYQNDIYMAGYVNVFPNLQACYWKNGQRVDLTDASENAIARSIFVTDTHVYVAGTINQRAVYWKDGEVIILTKEGTNSMANSIFVQGADVHVGGYDQGHPAYWKNDIKQNISNQERLGQILCVVVGSN